MSLFQPSMVFNNLTTFDKSCETWTSSSGQEAEMNDQHPDLEIPIWIGGCEKWINGLTRRTTCDDIIYALLRHDSNPNENFDVQSYVIFERWRSVERSLRGRTKILKAWRAWGSEIKNVKFSVNKMECILDNDSEIYKPRRSRRHREPAAAAHGDAHVPVRNRDIKDRERTKAKSNHRGARSTYENLHQPGQDRKTLRETTKNTAASRESQISKSTSSPKDRSKATASKVQDRSKKSHEQRKQGDHKEEEGVADEESVQKSKAFHQLVQVIIDQEKRLQEQQARLHETDVQIESYETTMHELRMQENGRNYVQEAYLRSDSSSTASSGEDLFPNIKAHDMDAYLNMCENILGLQDRICKEESKIEDLSVRIFDESQLFDEAFDCRHHGPMSSTPQASVLATAATAVEGGRPPAATPEPLQAATREWPQRDSSLDANDCQLLEEMRMLKNEMERSMSLSVAQQRQAHLVNNTLLKCEEELERKRNYVTVLTAEMDGENHDAFAPDQDRANTLSLSCTSQQQQCQQQQQHQHQHQHQHHSYYPQTCETLERGYALRPTNVERDAQVVFSESRGCDNNDNLHQTIATYDDDHGCWGDIKDDSPATHHNSDSGVESNGNDKADDTPSCSSADQDHVFEELLPVVRGGGGGAAADMVPYCTYATFDTQLGAAPVGCSTQGRHNTSDDTNSDTGLSSLNSDDPAAPGLETLV